MSPQNIYHFSVRGFGKEGPRAFRFCGDTEKRHALHIRSRLHKFDMVCKFYAHFWFSCSGGRASVIVWKRLQAAPGQKGLTARGVPT